MSRSVELAALLLCGACGDAPMAPADAGAPPLALPALAPCPTGWAEVPFEPVADATRCEPWPGSGRADCALGEAHFPGTPGCAPIGDPCPLDGVPAGIPTSSSVRHVRAGSPSGGDGSLGAPFGTIAEALAGAAPGTVIAIGVGTYDEAVALPAGVTLWGACATDTTVRAAAPATITVDGDGAAIENLTVSGTGRGIDVGPSAGTLALRGVVLSGLVGRAVAVRGDARVVGDDVAVRGVDADTVDLPASVGFYLAGASTAALTRIAISGTADGAIWAGAIAGGDDTALELEDASIAMHEGVGIACIDCTMNAARIVVETVRGAGILTRGGQVTIADAVLRDVRTDRAFATFGRAIFAESAVVTARKVYVDAATEAALTVGYGTGTLELSDVIVSGTRSTDTGRSGRGLIADRAAHATVTRGLFIDNRDVSVAAFGDGSEIRLEDVRILRTLPRDCAATDCGDAPAGVGLGAYSNAAARAERFVVDDAALCGVQLARGGSLDLSVGVVSRALVGACVQVDGYDLGRLSDRVRYHDNGANLQATSLPVPDP